MNFEVTEKAAKMVAYLETLECIDDEELDHIMRMRNINAFRKSSTRLLPQMPPNEIRQLVLMTQMRRKRPMSIQQGHEYDPLEKDVEMNPLNEVKRLRSELENCKEKLAVATQKLAQVRSAIDNDVLEEVELEDEV